MTVIGLATAAAPCGGRGAFLTKKAGDDHIITAENPEKYASYVEYGHRQTPGRYVPALGKRLKASWVNGKFMLRTSADEISEQYPKAVQKVVDEALKEVFRGK